MRSEEYWQPNASPKAHSRVVLPPTPPIPTRGDRTGAGLVARVLGLVWEQAQPGLDVQPVGLGDQFLSFSTPARLRPGRQGDVSGIEQP